MIWQCFLIVILMWVLVIRWKNRGKRELAKKLRNDLPMMPVIGAGLRFYGNDEVSVDAEDSEFVSKACLEKDHVLSFLHILLGNGSIFAPASIWRPRRKVLAPTFSSRNLNRFVCAFAEKSTVLANRLQEKTGKGTFSLWNYMCAYTMDSISESTLGVKLGVQNQPDNQFQKCLDTFVETVAARILQPWFHSDFIYKFTSSYARCLKACNYMKDFVKTIIINKRKEVKEKKKEQITNDSSEEKCTRTILEMLIESSGGDQGFTDLELLEETLVMMAAGTDTSAVGACFTAVMLSKHLDVQEKVYEELQEVLGDDDKPITAENLPRLKYLEAVLKETLRLYPPVPMTARVADKDVVLPSGLKLVAGAGFILHVFGIHRNPKYWGNDAEIFRPERFFDSPPTHPSAFMPFSIGPRSCLGYQYAMMSLKTVLATIVRRYQILPAELTQKGDVPLRVKYDIMMKHVDNYQIQLRARK